MFPEVDRPEGDAWCDALKCKEDDGQEVEWLEKVIGKVGRAIFWHNLDPYGNPDPDTLHAGTPVVQGTKVGLNIWTRENPYRNGSSMAVGCIVHPKAWGPGQIILDSLNMKYLSDPTHTIQPRFRQLHHQVEPNNTVAANPAQAAATIVSCQHSRPSQMAGRWR